jgi:hypothetical protein
MTDETTEAPRRPSGLTVVGNLIAAIGFGIIVHALAVYDPTVATPITDAMGLDVMSGNGVYNIGLLQEQFMRLVLGCTMAMAGVVMACTGQIKNAIADKDA